MHARFLTTLALVVLAALAPAAATASRSARAAARAATTYTDSTGEAATAPDITTVSVGNDDAGVVTFTINAAGPPQLAPGTAFLVLLDTDRNPATGNADAVGA